MFVSKRRELLIPQSEHAALAGIVASLWGNPDFDKPPINFESFVQGVTLHDLGHGYLDQNPIGEMPLEQERQVDEALVRTRLADPIADLVVKFHVRRLLGYDKRFPDLIAEIDQRIDTQLQQIEMPRADFEWADSITGAVDFISFDFCFEVSSQREIEVARRVRSSDRLPFTFAVKPHGEVLLEPWPLCVAEYSGQITGYRRAGYPDRLEPVAVPYHIKPWRS